MNDFENYFDKFKQLVYDNYGIFFSDAKKGLLSSKIKKLMQRNSITSFNEYYNALKSQTNKKLVTEFINEITVNKTEFFRENMHFTFLKNNLPLLIKKNPRIVRNREIRVWCSACSTGQEAYTIAMVLKDLFQDQLINIKILATDISSKVLEIAQIGKYSITVQTEITPDYLNRYFTKLNGQYHVAQELKSMITFRKFNLMETFPFSNQFDIIFCRNVMIYFDVVTQEQLVKKFYDYMPLGGLLFIGQSESLINKKNTFNYLQPSIYFK